ncbi:hypothetical protein P153DRAFT_307215 [Dothidotthia symphoricarpi CBS 119687]|uniref:Uncharacterized protein n=1 Tax=Dothidotthia symphoricarpi CBS 119687 TaxID=1392245 RepID=A0A6A6ATD1_9PLEO|nr:uncharacterized protein P153DRAFT_307215 [Dothidotthia symphoricarpi CBS 119687]KAF2134224.1 hypothetical protein P153DRAFT_307215 [Dothidotthia symphoricarpi CBS 119687]
MAFNWDRLQKSQRDFPKPKLALAAANKALKKQSSNPYLLAWRLDISLQLELNEPEVTQNLANAIGKTTITDSQLLAYAYRLLTESARRQKTTDLSGGSNGDIGIKPWENAAKGLKSGRDRYDLWNTLFKTAMREDCWEDVRAAVVRYNKEKPSGIKKLMYFLNILATQLAAEMNVSGTGTAQTNASMQLMLAHRQLKQAYEKPIDEAIAIKDIRDLRFMAEIFKRQGRCTELFALWGNPPDGLKEVMSKHHNDLMSLKTRILSEEEKWDLLKDHCIAYIEQSMSQVDNESERTWELCARNWDVWKGLMDAVLHTGRKPETMDVISELIDRCFKPGVHIQDRPLRLTYMKLQQFVDRPFLSDCKDYWEHHSRLPSCFKDLRPLVESLSEDDQEDFLKFVEEKSYGLKPSPADGQQKLDNWLQAEFNVLKFTYLLTISQRKTPTPEALESLIGNALRLLKLWPENSEVGYLAVYGLHVLHHRTVLPDVPNNSTGTAHARPFNIYNPRILLQATMLARHLVQRDVDKSDRTGSLLAARLHLNLGLGKTAFHLYSHTKLKEMLLDTLSPYILSRISLTHPFDIKGYQSFSAEAELSKVISTIEKMEVKLGSLLLTDISSFAWDQAIDMLVMKEKLKSSYTKHLCTMERRRIARMKGESSENFPCLSHTSYLNISDNVDRTVFPDFEVSGTGGLLDFLMPANIPNKDWFIHSCNDWDRISKVLYQEGAWSDFSSWHEKAVDSQYDPKKSQPNMVLMETSLKEIWHSIKILGVEAHMPGIASAETLTESINVLMKELSGMRQAMENLRVQGPTGLKPEDEMTMLTEGMLIACYTKLEVLRALNKLLNLLGDKVIKTKVAHPLKAKLPADFVPKLSSDMLKCYQAIRDVAESYIDLIKKRGMVAIQAQVRWGPTGKILERLLSDDDVDSYAGEYVDSMIEAWNGVLKVKLK